MRILNCGHDKATKVMRELEQMGLIIRIPKKMGPYKIIVDMTLLDTKEQAPEI